MSIFDYCLWCWAQLPGFPETEDYPHVACPDCHDEHEALQEAA